MTEQQGQDQPVLQQQELEEATPAGNEAAASAGAENEAAESTGSGSEAAASAGAENEAAESAGAGNEAAENGFAALGLHPALVAKLAEAGIVEPTPVQAAVIPPLLEGRDGVLRSPTGSGKTLAYLLPILQQIDPKRRETQAVVFAPTQELAMQIVRVGETYGEPLGIKTVALIGGAALSRQLDRMKAKPALVVGTPGRIREVVSLKKLPLHAIKQVVVDETDRVFSLGGKSDVENVLRGAAKERQTVFVSATRSDTMRAAEAKWLRDPWETSEEEEQGTGLPPTIEHLFFLSDARDKIDLVRKIIRTTRPESALVFVNDIERIGELLSKLRYEGFAVDALYGDTPGRERGEVLRKFREGKTKLLIATDVAARGLDVPGLALVLQFEPALDADHYVHRAGRTGRMGRSGRSITIVTPQEKFIMTKLGKQLGIVIAERRLQHGRLTDPGAPAGRPPQRQYGQAEAEARPANEAGQPPRAGAARSDGAQPGRGARDGVAAGKPRGAHPAASRGEAAGAKPAAGGAAKTSGKSSQAAAGKPASKPQQASPAKPTKAKMKAERERDKKNKGAPRWLKEKQSQGPSPEAP